MVIVHFFSKLSLPSARGFRATTIFSLGFGMDAILPGTIQGKVWGKTQRIFCANNVQVDRLHARAGWQCSMHFHRAKANMFFVESGEILVRTSKDGLTDETTIKAGQSTVVRPGDKHQFVAVRDSVVLEIYWVCLDPDDIIRETQGGPAVTTTCGTRSGQVPIQVPSVVSVLQKAESAHGGRPRKSGKVDGPRGTGRKSPPKRPHR